jgi:hypothetical protein
LRFLYPCGDGFCQPDYRPGGVCGREPAQLVVDEWEQVGRGAAVAGRGRVEEAAYVGYASQHTGCRWELPHGARSTS